MNQQFESFFNVIDNHSSFIILIHVNADGDAIGSSTALALFLKKAGKNAAVVSPSAIPKKLDFAKNKNILYFESYNSLISSNFAYDCVLSIDVASDELLSDSPELKNIPISYAIDHHRINTLKALEKYVDASAASAGEILFSMIREYEKERKAAVFDSEICSSIYTSISSDTGCFKFSNTSSFSHAAASFLLEHGVDAEKINRLLFDTKSLSQIKVEQFAYQNMKLFYENRFAIVIIDKDDLEMLGASDEDTDAVSQLLRTISGVQISVLMHRKTAGNDEVSYKFSVRSNLDIDVSKLCAVFGGGGHKKAAGCTIHDTKERAFEKFTAAAKDFLI